MNQSYELLIHKTFQTQALGLKARNPRIEDALIAALQEISADPFPGAMQGVITPRLQGVIHKKHVGGRKGHRLIYLYPKGSKFVIPVFISPTPKPPFDYDQVDWEEICKGFFKDYTSKNYSAFISWKK